MIIKSYNMSKSCCHTRYLKRNDIRCLMSKRVLVFEEIKRYLLKKKPKILVIMK